MCCVVMNVLFEFVKGQREKVATNTIHILTDSHLSISNVATLCLCDHVLQFSSVCFLFLFSNQTARGKVIDPLLSNKYIEYHHYLSRLCVPLIPSGYYRVYQLISQPFLIAVHKEINVISSIGIDLFTMAIISVYKEENSNNLEMVRLPELSLNVNCCPVSFHLI